jgi:hypothetical protein
MGNMRNQGPLGLFIPSNGKYYHLIENKLNNEIFFTQYIPT